MRSTTLGMDLGLELIRILGSSEQRELLEYEPLDVFIRNSIRAVQFILKVR